MLDTQNTNVNAIRFYRELRFSMDAVDISHYFNLGETEISPAAFFMKHRLEGK